MRIMGEVLKFPYHRIRYDDITFDPENFSERELSGESAKVIALLGIRVEKQTVSAQLAFYDPLHGENEVLEDCLFETQENE